MQEPTLVAMEVVVPTHPEVTDVNVRKDIKDLAVWKVRGDMCRGLRMGYLGTNAETTEWWGEMF